VVCPINVGGGVAGTSCHLVSHRFVALLTRQKRSYAHDVRSLLYLVQSEICEHMLSTVHLQKWLEKGEVHRDLST
jgi:hypothetical protein